MLIATSRIKEMAILKRIDLANLLPSVGGKISAEREFENDGGNNKDITNTFEGKLLFSWELDLWGNLRWGREKGIAEYLQSVEAQRALQMTLVATVAEAYFELMHWITNYLFVRRTLATREEGVRQAKRVLKMDLPPRHLISRHKWSLPVLQLLFLNLKDRLSIKRTISLFWRVNILMQ